MKSLISKKRICAAASLAATLGGLVGTALEAPEALALGAANLLLVAMASGWILRSAVHGLMGYFRPVAKPGVPRYRLLRLSILNVIFGALWLSAALFVSEHPDPAPTGIVSAVAILVAFLFALRTHPMAEAAGLERGSEWMRGHLREPLEPAAGTVVGWPLVMLLDWPSPKQRLSPYVAGTLAVMLAALLLVAPGALTQVGRPPHEKGPDSNAVRAPQITPLFPASPCGRTFSVRA